MEVHGVADTNFSQETLCDLVTVLTTNQVVMDYRHAVYVRVGCEYYLIFLFSVQAFTPHPKANEMFRYKVTKIFLFMRA